MVHLQKRLTDCRHLGFLINKRPHNRYSFTSPQGRCFRLIRRHKPFVEKVFRSLKRLCWQGRYGRCQLARWTSAGCVRPRVIPTGGLNRVKEWLDRF